MYLAKKLRAACDAWPEAEKLGAQCLADALRALPAKLAENAGDDGSAVLAKLGRLTDPWRGYDVTRHTMTDLQKAGILMPRGTVEAILSTAAETAGSLLTTSAAVMEGK